MPNEKLLATLQETRTELVEQRYTLIERQQTAQTAVEDARIVLSTSRNRARIAIQQDEDKKAAMEALRNHLNGLTEKPQVLQGKLDRLGAEQLGTFRNRNAAEDIVREGQGELGEAETRLTIARTDMDRIDQDIRHIDEQIRNAQST